jgi:GT2 family glycosyltransferase
LREDRNTGFAAAANRGIGATDQPWVLLLNPDCAVRPDFTLQLFTALANFTEGPRVGSITAKLMRAKGPTLEPSRIVDAAGMLMTCSGRHFDRGAGTADTGQFDRPAWVFGGTGAATLFRRQALADVAYPNGEIFAETFFAYREDAELAWRLQLRGWRCLYVPRAKASHGRGFKPEKGRLGHAEINLLSVRNRFLLRGHCADIGWHLRCLPWWLLRDLVVVGACLTVERTSASGLREAWRMRNDIGERRRWVQQRRIASPRQIARWFRRRGRVEEVETS